MKRKNQQCKPPFFICFYRKQDYSIKILLVFFLYQTQFPVQAVLLYQFGVTAGLHNASLFKDKNYVRVTDG